MAMLSGANRVVTAVMTTGHRSFIYGTQSGERIAIREAEVVKESRFLGAEPRFLRLPFYDSNYEVTERDLDIFVALLAGARSRLALHCRTPRTAIPRTWPAGRWPSESLRRYLAGTRKIVDLWNYEGPWALFNRGEFNTIVTVPAAGLRAEAAGHPGARVAGDPHALRRGRRVPGAAALRPRSRSPSSPGSARGRRGLTRGWSCSSGRRRGAEQAGLRGCRWRNECAAARRRQ